MIGWLETTLTSKCCRGTAGTVTQWIPPAGPHSARDGAPGGVARRPRSLNVPSTPPPLRCPRLGPDSYNLGPCLSLGAPSTDGEELLDLSPRIAHDLDTPGCIPLAPGTMRLAELADFPCSSYVCEPAELIGTLRANLPSTADAGARVTFALSDTHSVHCSEYEVPAYGEVYGMAPWLFNFDAQGMKVPTPAAYKSAKSSARRGRDRPLRRPVVAHAQSANHAARACLRL